MNEELRVFLQGIAVLGVFRGDMCDEVLERSDSEARLYELEHVSLFLSRLGKGGWFRLHSLLADYVRVQGAVSAPVEAGEIHRRAAEWFLSHGMPLEAVEHASAAGDHEMVARMLVEHHVRLIQGGAGGTLLRWIRTLPEDCVVRHPELTVAAAMSALFQGCSIVEQRRYLQFADRAAQTPSTSEAAPYVEVWSLIARALALHGGVAEAVTNGRRARELTADRTDTSHTGALVATARALFYAGDLEEAFRITLRALEQPGIEVRTPTLVLAHSTLALVCVEQGRLSAALGHAEQARAAITSIGARDTWLAANASVAFGAVLAAEEKFVEAEYELATAAHVFTVEGATVHAAWLLVLLARVRLRRGRLEEAQTTLGAAWDALAELGDSGRVPALATEAGKELESARESPPGRGARGTQ